MWAPRNLALGASTELKSVPFASTSLNPAFLMSALWKLAPLTLASLKVALSRFVTAASCACCWANVAPFRLASSKLAPGASALSNCAFARSAS